MLLVVFAKVDVVGQIHVIRASAVGSGIMGVMVNLIWLPFCYKTC